jgi:hypothetical protein
VKKLPGDCPLHAPPHAPVPALLLSSTCPMSASPGWLPTSLTEHWAAGPYFYLLPFLSSTSYPSYLPMVAVSSPICSSTTLPVCPPYLLPSFQFPLITSQSFETDLAPSSSCLSSVMIRSLTPPLQTSTPKMFWSHLMAPTLAEDRVPHHSDSWFSPEILATWASILFDMRANTANPNEASPWVSLFPGVKFSNIQALTSSQAV